MCILENYPECSNPKVFYIIPYFCGQHPQCRYTQVAWHALWDTRISWWCFIFCFVKLLCYKYVFLLLSLTVIFLPSQPESLEYGLWRGPNKMCWRTTSLWVSWRSWRMFCFCWRGCYLITLQEYSTSTRALVHPCLSITFVAAVPIEKFSISIFL